MRPLVAIDTETTGLEPGCRLIELAAVVFDLQGGTGPTFSRLVHPEMLLPPDIPAITGIDDALLTDAEPASAVLEDFRRWLPAEAICFAHNVRFDCDVLGYECDRAHREMPVLRCVDTIRLGTALRGPGSCRLHDLVAHYGLPMRGRAHRALPDADATRHLVLQAQRDLPPQRFTQLLRPDHRRGTWRHPRTFRPPHDRLPALVRAGARVDIGYTDAGGRRSERTVDLYGYASTPQGIRFHGWCHLRQARRNFALERTEWL